MATFFIRTENNDNVVDCKVWETKDGPDMSIVVCIRQYSRFLLKQPTSNALEIITDFDDLQELRGEWFEKGFGSVPIKEFVRSKFKEIVEKYPNLYYVED